ncbi:MAG: SIS domain-containing protein [Acidimicrobiia bacterium]
MTGVDLGPERLDTLGMWEATLGLPEQVEAAIGLADQPERLPDRDDIDNIVVLGMGGSGLAGDVMIAAAGQFVAKPIVVCKSYESPNFADEHTLCFAMSFSGNTEETVEAAQEAAAAGARMVAVTRGGRLAELARAWDAPMVTLPDGIPMPRAGLAALAVPPLLILERMGLFPGAHGWARSAADQLRARRDQLSRPDNAASELARRIGAAFPLVYGGAALGGTAALRWKNQIAENAKAPAFYGQVPELMHNDICGWGQHGDVTRQVFRAVLLRHDFEHPQVVRRFELLRRWIDEAVAGIDQVEAEGDGPLAQFFDLVLFGDVVSLHMALDAGIDPGPVPVLDEIKAVLAQ